MEASPEAHHRLGAMRREGERVTPLELFFDLVFVLAITQCTALMSHDQSWSGLAQGLLILGVLWWAWVGYSWLTSVIDPEAGAVRGVIFVAMAAMLIVSLCVQEAFGNLALTFALAFGVFRSAHIALFMIAGADDSDLRRSVIGLGISTAVAVGILALASLFDGFAQGALWALAIFLDMAGPYFFGSEGWKLVPGHFAERHGLIVIIALGESVVAVGVGASGALDLGIGVAAVLGIFLAAALWWTYFDVVALVSARRLGQAEPGRVQNELARDSYSYIHLLMVAGIVLMALGMKVTIGHHSEHLHDVPAFALLGGLALYLIGLVSFRYRHIQTVNRQRLGLAIVLLFLVPAATAVPALISLAVAVVLIWAMIGYEHRGYGAGRQQLRREANVAHNPAP
ncbi:MAG TPA: low temperature requirement protein A [Solirubrobacterales bacterium]|jgi:low temperature requirement protein LtrA|nr:low temperature requirement protein A [Solirubrobacterales bacterium]